MSNALLAPPSPGGLDPIAPGAVAHRSFQTLADDFAIEFRVLRGSTRTAEFIDNRLRLSHVLIVYNLSPGVSHTNVVYGVGFPTGKEKLISAMDPSITTHENSTGLNRNRPISFYQSRDFVIVGWPRP